MPGIIELQTSQEQQFLEFTSAVQDIVRSSHVLDGICVAYCAHTTAALTINENADPDVTRDMLHTLNRMIELHDPAYRHAEGNSAHVKASLMGSSVTVPVESGRLALGTWQGIYLFEFDGPRRRKVIITVLESS